jgi:hypothetical protein
MLTNIKLGWDYMLSTYSIANPISYLSPASCLSLVLCFMLRPTRVEHHTVRQGRGQGALNQRLLEHFIFYFLSAEAARSGRRSLCRRKKKWSQNSLLSLVPQTSYLSSFLLSSLSSLEAVSALGSLRGRCGRCHAQLKLLCLSLVAACLDVPTPLCVRFLLHRPVL